MKDKHLTGKKYDLEGGCAGMVSTSDKAVEQLRERLVKKCFEAGIGFRLLINIGESNKETFSIKLDRQHQGDEVIESNGIKIFLDTASVARISNYQLDYRDEPGGGFFLNTTQEATSR